MNLRHTLILVLALATINARAASMVINSLSGPVTTSEINSFITFMQEQTPPQTPWGDLTGTNGAHNEWADGTGGRELEAMGEMYEVSSNITTLNQMISWTDDCVSQRNDLMTVANGGQRVMWTGLVDEVWCPNEPSSANAGYAGCENEDTEGHIAFCAILILESPSLWNTTVPDGDPHGYGTTYLQRATNYLAKCDQANEEYSLKWFITPGTYLVQAPTNAAWVAFDENVNAINRQMMFTSGFQRLAEAHQLLGDNPSLMAQYDNIVAAFVGQCLSGMISFDPYSVKGQPVYDWGYYPTTDAPEATEIHAEYDIIGVYRAFNRTNYGLTLSPLVPFANTMVDVIYLGTNTFAGDVSGGSGVQSPIYSGWIYPADWNPAVYNVVAGAAYTNGWYETSADIEGGILWMKNRIHLEFSVSATPSSTLVRAGTGTSFTTTVSPLGGFTNVVNMSVSGLPSGASASFNSPSINLATLNYASSNVTLSISTSASTPTGTYPLAIVGTSSSVAHTNTVSLIVGNFNLTASPSTQTGLIGATNISYTVTLATNTGFNGTVSFGLSGLPSGASASFNPASLSGAGSSTLTVNAGSAPAGSYILAITGTNGSAVASTTASLILTNQGYVVWNGGSAIDNNWSDAANWGGGIVMSNESLFFGGTTRLNNTNDTTAGTIFTNITFNAGAGGFVLGGNSIILASTITNASSNPQTIELGLDFNSTLALSGGGSSATPLIIGGGLNDSGNATAVYLNGWGTLSNNLTITGGAGTGTNALEMINNSANWMLVNNRASTSVTLPWGFEILAGTFTFGTATSAPNFTSTPVNAQINGNDNQVGDSSGATGTFNMVNGTLTSEARFNTALAANSTGIVNMSGGTWNMGSQFQGANGSNPDEVSALTVSGGTLNIGSASNPTSPIYVASRGAGTFTMSGPAVVNCGTLDVSRNAYGNTVGSVGTVNLNGGTLTVNLVGTATANSQTGPASSGPSPSAAFNFNGGTLVARENSSSFFQGSTVAPIIPITATVKSGGAIINDDGFAISILEGLLHDSTLGATNDGGLTKLGAGTATLTRVNTYTGATTISNGTLALGSTGSISDSVNITIAAGATLNASASGTLTVSSGQTLTGGGNITGALTSSAGSTVAPGSSSASGTLTVSGAVALQGMTLLKLNPASSTNDVVAGSSITYGGTLNLTNLSGMFAAGNTFKLFNATTYNGSFTNLTPAIPAIGLGWQTNNLSVNGAISVISQATPQPVIIKTVLVGNNLVISGSNGLAGLRCVLSSSTNVALPLNQWTPVATNVFGGGNFSLTNTINTNIAQEFYILEIP